MAPIPANIHVSFTSNYAGPHRVCWRTNNTGPYDCSTIVNCLGGGNACSVDIPVTVDNETCLSVEFDGYVQAACEVEGSLSGRIPFSTTFTPVPVCASYEISCHSAGVSTVVPLVAGSGYDPGAAPSVVFSGGGGTLAAATAHVGNGGVKTWTISNGGAGYDSGGSAVFLNTAATGGTGAGVFFNVTVTAGVITSIVLSASSTSPGSGYLVGDTLSFGNLGGTGGGTAVITINTLNTSEIQYYTVSVNGSGYSSTPLATVDPPVGFGGHPNIQATTTVTMLSCPEGALPSCDGSHPTHSNVKLGDSFNICSSTVPVIDPATGYTVTPLGCCYDCVSVTFTATVTNVNMNYTDCTTRDIVHHTVAVGVPFTICAVNNSWWTNINQGPLTVLVGAAC